MAGPTDGRPPSDPETLAIAYLSREVPRWSRENRCFSCHNNGDAAKALLASGKSPDALADTLDWLAHPDRWEKNRGDAAFSDKKLARLQFAAALASAIERWRIDDKNALVRAASDVAADQSEDGSWSNDEAGPVGSPAAYGRPIATVVAVQTLRRAEPNRFDRAITRGEDWLRARPLANVHEAAAVLMIVPDTQNSDRILLRKARDFLLAAQTDDGGWGPFARSSPEAYDTAVALLALSRWPERSEVAASIRRGRSYLAATQNEDGGWPETTRPPGGESYAQRISTAGWAAQALIATRPEVPTVPGSKP